MSARVKGAIVGAGAMLLLLVVIALIIILTGGYNVAANDRHNPIIGWALTTTMENSVQARAGGVQDVPRFTADMIHAGAGDYKAMCSHCHGGVGESRAKWAQTMRPMPPPLAHAAAEWKPEEVFWIVKHGVKMSGMPSFGPTHDDQAIWNITAFVKELPRLTQEQYASSGAEDHRSGGHSH